MKVHENREKYIKRAKDFYRYSTKDYGLEYYLISQLESNDTHQRHLCETIYDLRKELDNTFKARFDRLVNKVLKYFQLEKQGPSIYKDIM